MRKNIEVAEAFSSDEMTRNFVKAFNGIIFAVGQVGVFEFHGQNLKVVVKGLLPLELAEEQQRGAPPPQRHSAQQDFGILMDKTDITFIKAGDSSIKIKSNSKKSAGISQ